jgi:hypothetical protein
VRFLTFIACLNVALDCLLEAISDKPSIFAPGWQWLSLFSFAGWIYIAIRQFARD